jgi:hypothetical protein
MSSLRASATIVALPAACRLPPAVDARDHCANSLLLLEHEPPWRIYPGAAPASIPQRAGPPTPFTASRRTLNNGRCCGKVPRYEIIRWESPVDFFTTSNEVALARLRIGAGQKVRESLDSRKMLTPAAASRRGWWRRSQNKSRGRHSAM